MILKLFPIKPMVVSLDNPSGLTDFASIFGSGGILSTQILPLLYSIVGLILFILIIYSGITWQLSTGDPEKVKKAMNTLINAAIGLGIVIFAYAATKVVGGLLDFNSIIG